MGKAVIVSAVAEGLYRIRRRLAPDRITAELKKLDELDATYFARLNDALRSLDDLRRAKAEAADALNEVVQQWKDALISKLNEEPPAIPPPEPNDPETGLPWADNDRAQDKPLFEAINAERTAESLGALTRSADLDRSILRHLRIMATTGRIRHDERGWTAADRARAAGYHYDAVVGVGQVQAFGTRTPAEAVALWMRRSSDRNKILGEDYTECGVGYIYAPRNPYSYLWGAVFAKPGPPLPEFVEPEPNPAEEAADEAESALEKIPLPTIEGFEPDKFGEVAAELARAAQRVRVAETVVANLLGESLNRNERRRELEAARARADAVIDCWCCVFAEDVPIGATVNTVEIPGYYTDAAVPKFTTMNVRTADLPGRSGREPDTVAYQERPLVIVPDPFPTGQLQHTTVMTPAAVFHAAAMEPGAHRWRPLWRYGVITLLSGNTCNVTLTSAETREPRGALNDPLPLDIPEDLFLSAVPISYPPCNGEAFEEGDEVLILFEGFNRTTPKVIGFRREPRPCAGGGSWRQY